MASQTPNVQSDPPALSPRDKTLAVTYLLVGGVVAYFLMRFDAQLLDQIHHQLAFLLPIYIVGGIVVVLSPPKRVWATQTYLLIMTLFIATLICFRGSLLLWAVGTPIALAGALRWLPLSNRRVLVGTIFVVTAVMPWLQYIRHGMKADSVLGVMLYGFDAALLQFLLAALVFSTRRPRGYTECLRGMCGPRIFPPISAVADEMLRIDRSPSSVLRGVFWMNLGLAIIPCLNIFMYLYYKGIIVPEPASCVQLLFQGKVGLAIVHAACAWVQLFLMISPTLYVDFGTARMLGVPLPVPMDKPWMAPNFLEYWRRWNVPRYMALKKVYFETFFQPRGRKMVVGILVVFFITYWHHIFRGHSETSVAELLRWGMDGMATAATAWWLERTAKARVRKYLKNKGKKQPKATVFRTMSLRVLGALVVFFAHGFFADMIWGNWLRKKLPSVG